MGDKSIINVWNETNSIVKYLLLGVFINQFGFFIQAYLIVFMIHQGFSSVAAGWGLTLLCSFSILGAIFGSNCGLKYGNKINIIFSSCGLGITVLLIPLLVRPEYPSYFWVSIVAICGFFSQMYRPSASVMLSEYMPAEYHVLGFSMFRIAMNLGAALGPLVATLLATFDWKYVFWLNSVTALMFALMACFCFKNDTKPKIAPQGAQESESWLIVLKDTKYWFFLLAMCISSMVYIQFFSSVPVAIANNGMTLKNYSSLLIAYSLTLIICELKISNIVRKLPAWKPALVGTFILCFGVSTFGLTLVHGELVILSALILVGGLMISGPTMFAYPASFPLHIRGKYIAANQISFTVGNALGPIIGLKLLAWNINSVWLFCFASALICSCFIYYGMKPKRELATVNSIHVESSER